MLQSSPQADVQRTIFKFCLKRTVDVLASYPGVGERHDLQRPGRLQQALAVRAQRNAEGGQGGISIVVHGGDRNLL